MATQYYEPDFHNPDSFNGTPPFAPPEPHLGSCGRGDVWAVGASVLSLCRLLPRGPIEAPPPHHPNPRAWYLDPKRRRHLPQLGPGHGYSEELGIVLADTVAFHMDDRFKSKDLMREVRIAEEILFSSPDSGVKVRLLPEWVYDA